MIPTMDDSIPNKSSECEDYRLVIEQDMTVKSCTHIGGWKIRRAGDRFQTDVHYDVIMMVALLDAFAKKL